ncbi:LysR family transcriptional regulator [Trinickia mobilis]|uniref:LysR family transcriptional regulator n=1 Tax=Trinickia mobilis TaxID=2816356 RepID=UPI001A8EE087|nr:LysR family transcriptional regulator [Trinickia mobilis]
MNTRFVETFVTLARLRSFRATARALHATPAAISLRVKKLEAELQTQLIDRSTGDFQLTANGEYLLGHAKALLEASRRLHSAALAHNDVRGRLRLGVIESVVHSWLADYIRQLNAVYPQLEIDLTVDMSSVLQERLLARELDLIVRVDGIDSDNAVSEALAYYPVRWIAQPGLITASNPGARLVKRVLGLPLLTFARGTAPHRALEDIVATLAAEHGMPVGQTRITCSPSVAAIVRLVKDGYGVAAIPSLFVAQELEANTLVELQIDPQPASIVVSLSRHRDCGMMVHAAAKAARVVCAAYCSTMNGRLIRTLAE